MRAYASGSCGSPHSSHSVIVSGRSGSSMVVTMSTNGTSATMAANRSGRRLATAPMSSPPALPPRATSDGRRVALRDERLGARDEVGERVGLVIEAAVFVPAPAQLAAAAHVRDRAHEAAIEQRDARRAERRVARVLVRAVAGEQRGRAAVERDIAPVHDGDRDARAVGGGRPTAAPTCTRSGRSRRGPAAPGPPSRNPTPGRSRGRSRARPATCSRSERSCASYSGFGPTHML